MSSIGKSVTCLLVAMLLILALLIWTIKRPTKYHVGQIVQHRLGATGLVCNSWNTFYGGVYPVASQTTTGEVIHTEWTDREIIGVVEEKR